MKNNILESVNPFDVLSKTYDADFSHTELGRLLRLRTHEKMEELFPAGSSVLEINCGTGEDACFLARRGIQVTATDGSLEMIKRSTGKIEFYGLSDRVTFRHCRMEELDSILKPGQEFDGIVSNFGGLNCTEEPEFLAEKLVQRVRAGGHLFLCIMGRWTPWEWLYLGCRGKFKRIYRRISGITEWRGLTVRYYMPGQIKKLFNSHCDVLNVYGLGFLLPPTYAGTLVTKYPALFRWLNSIERKIESIAGIPACCDHFMIVLKKK